MHTTCAHMFTCMQAYPPHQLPDRLHVGLLVHMPDLGRGPTCTLTLPTCQPTQRPARPACTCVLPSVNLPGYFYSITAAGAPSATPCGPDSYSPGWKKQRACVPCPTGFSTAGAVEAKAPTACGTYPVAEAYVERDAAASNSIGSAVAAESFVVKIELARVSQLAKVWQKQRSCTGQQCRLDCGSPCQVANLLASEAQRAGRF